MHDVVSGVIESGVYRPAKPHDLMIKTSMGCVTVQPNNSSLDVLKICLQNKKIKESNI